MVVALVGIVAAVLAVRLGSSSTISLRASARALAAELEFAAQRALTTGRAQRWVVDLDQQQFRIEEQALPAALGDAGGRPAGSLAAPITADGFTPIPHDFGDWRVLDEPGIGIGEILLAGEPVATGEVALTFAPDGGADPATLWLLDDEARELEIEVTGFTGEIEVGEVLLGG